MRLHLEARRELPPLAWCAVVETGRPEVRVLHGAGLETREDAFFEAAWNGPFERFDPAASSVFCGTGGWVAGDAVRFSASSDRLSPLFSVRRRGRLHVSNSPIFAMVMAGEAPSDTYPFYSSKFLETWRMGLRRPDGRIPLRFPARMGFHVSTVMTVEAGGRVSFQPHPPGDEPRDFASYRALLLDGVRGLLANAGDPRRRTTYQPLAAISRGYDSTATAALAAAAGCKEAVSLIELRPPDPHADSGRENALRLGMTCIECPRWQYLELPGMPEMEFALWGTSIKAPLAPLAHVLQGRIFITGELGDIVWTPRVAEHFDELSAHWTPFMAGLGHAEFRLRIGYVTFSPAIIGARHNRAIARISRSPEMRDWSVSGDYDRPIPRRLAEEAGLPRGSFATSKQASGHAHFGRKRRASPGALADYLRFLEERERRASRLALALAKARTRIRYLLWDRTSTRKRRYVPFSAWRRVFPFLFHTEPLRLPPQFLFTFQWCFHHLRNRYTPALQEDEAS